MKGSRRVLNLLGYAVLCVSVIGCRPATPAGRIDGRLQADGQPMSRVLVVFVPEVGGQQGLSSGRGVTDANGRFVLIDEQGTERIKTGPYYITLEDLAVYDKPRNELPAHITQDSTPELATMYRQVGSTPLCYDVQTGRQSIVIDLQTNTVRVDDVSVSPEHVSDTGKNRPPHQQ